MSLTIYVYNHEKKRPATPDEISGLFINPSITREGYAEIDFRCENGLAIDSDSSGLDIEVMK